MRLRNIKNAQDIIKKSNYLIENPNNHKSNFKSLFKNDNPIYIEIGMGKGDFIINNALKYPNINFIGIEKYASVLFYACKKLDDINIPNLKIINMDASDIDNVFDKEIDKIYLNFSDPWPKNRHSNRRLTSSIFLNKYEKIFKGDYIIEMKTDNDILFEYSITSLSLNKYKLEYVALDYYSKDIKDNIPTEYEKKFVLKNNKIHKLIAVQKVDDSLLSNN